MGGVKNEKSTRWPRLDDLRSPLPLPLWGACSDNGGLRKSGDMAIEIWKMPSSSRDDFPGVSSRKISGVCRTGGLSPPEPSAVEPGGGWQWELLKRILSITVGKFCCSDWLSMQFVRIKKKLGF